MNAFKPYRSNEIFEDITTQEIDELYRKIMIADAQELEFYVTDHNTRIQLDPTFSGSQLATIMKKAILWRRRELQRSAIVAAKANPNPNQDKSFDLYTSLLGLLGSWEIGRIAGERMCKMFGVGTDLDEVDRLLGNKK